MPEIGLFPLELVLLPNERVPLHIFEDRYKELIGECLAEASEFGLILEDDDGLREIGTSDRGDRGDPHLRRRPDERAGRGPRAGSGSIELTEGRSFRTAEVEAVEDDGEEPTERRTSNGRCEVFRRLVAVAEAEQIDEPAVGSPTLSFELAARVDFGPELKQELLELRSEPKRLRRLAELLERAVAGADARSARCASARQATARSRRTRPDASGTS